MTPVLPSPSRAHPKLPRHALTELPEPEAPKWGSGAMGGPKLVQPFYPETSSYPTRPVSQRLRRTAQQSLSETALCERLDHDGAGEKHRPSTIPCLHAHPHRIGPALSEGILQNRSGRRWRCVAPRGSATCGQVSILCGAVGRTDTPSLGACPTGAGKLKPCATRDSCTRREAAQALGPLRCSVRAIVRTVQCRSDIHLRP
jgi:hypothetical protein